MKTSTIRFITTNFALATTLALLAGCVSHSYDKGAATSNALSSTATAVSLVSTNVNGVLASLNNLTFKSAGDLRNQYDALVSASKDLDSSMANLDSKVVSLRATAADYLNNWTNQMAAIQSEELRKRSSERKDEVSGKISDVETSYQGVTNSLAPFTSDVKDIQTYLGTDLTPTGLNTIKDIVSKTKVDAVPLRDSIKKLQGSFDSLSASLSPIMPSSPAN
jgi:tetrahydromethanopterin S-methyltransferase subunit B